MATTVTDAGKFELREITPEDAAAVAELSVQLGYPASTDEVRERIQAMIPVREGHLVRVACFRGKVVGWIEAEIQRHLQSDPYMLITGLVVKDGVRSLGVGKRLCREAEQWSRKKGIPIVRVTSRMTRERAHRFYLREGYVQTKTSAVFEKILS